MNAIKGRLLSTTTTVFTAAVVFMTLQRLKEAYLPPSAVVQDLKGANQSGSIAQANKDASKDEKKKSIDEMPTHPVAGEPVRDQGKNFATQ